MSKNTEKYGERYGVTDIIDTEDIHVHSCVQLLVGQLQKVAKKQHGRVADGNINRT